MAAPNIVSLTTITGKTAVANVTTVSANVITNAAASGSVLKINNIVLSNYTSATATGNVKTKVAGLTTGLFLDKDGYPRIKYNKRMWRLNRFIFKLVHGPIPEGFVVGHRCNNKGCINPNHLYLTTAAQNSTDAARDGLYRTDFVNPLIKNASEDWLTISLMYHNESRSQDSIGKLYGVHQSRISEILRDNKENFLEYLGDER